MGDPEQIPRLSPKELVAMRLLVGNELYGLELVKESDGALKRGTVYVLLDRLEKKGFIESRREKDESIPGLPRRLYKVTGLGQRVLRFVEEAQLMANRSGVLGGT